MVLRCDQSEEVCLEMHKNVGGIMGRAQGSRRKKGRAHMASRNSCDLNKFKACGKFLKQLFQLVPDLHRHSVTLPFFLKYLLVSLTLHPSLCRAHT